MISLPSLRLYLTTPTRPDMTSAILRFHFFIESCSSISPTICIYTTHLSSFYYFWKPLVYVFFAYLASASMGRGPEYLSVSTAGKSDNCLFKLLKTYEGLRILPSTRNHCWLYSQTPNAVLLRPSVHSELIEILPLSVESSQSQYNWISISRGKRN
jgi:hypothetical protein